MNINWRNFPKSATISDKRKFNVVIFNNMKGEMKENENGKHEENKQTFSIKSIKLQFPNHCC